MSIAMAAMAATASEQHLRAAVPLPLALQSDPYFKIGRPPATGHHMITWFLGVAVTEHGPGMLVSRNWGSAAGPLKCRGRLSLAGVAQGLCVSAFGFWARPRFGRRSLNTQVT
ncbi:uncharacterized protein K444DRAFT_101205 [Hyaloscypha bicolor E]|uniref:Uncharacterized protein n=1 Tax=Hyaloscypha bicolor E TaxID=1095630 RepID=A0A2J6SX43_9HELO|nr:uncharacterized protein K444DRAFT_101205 [Hyaloscypha bicolor E]PMD55233.1 hypothetical protein K444DRAFT_101205 [Hyaloscypha bicolor E]